MPHPFGRHMAEDHALQNPLEAFLDSTFDVIFLAEGKVLGS